MKWLADENFDNDIIRGLLRRVPGFDIIRVQDIGLSETDDTDLLDWATRNGRVVLTHDVSTMIPAMRSQLERVSRCARIVFVPASLPVGLVIDDIVLLDACSIPDDWSAGALYLPLR